MDSDFDIDVPERAVCTPNDTATAKTHQAHNGNARRKSRKTKNHGKKTTAKSAATRKPNNIKNAETKTKHKSLPKKDSKTKHKSLPKKDSRRKDQQVKNNDSLPTHRSSDTDGAAFVKKVAKRARRAESPEADRRISGQPILVGSDCAGYGSDFIALNLLRVDARLVFVAEMDPGKRELLKAAHPGTDFGHTIVYHDVTKRNNADAPYVDIFCTGAPCQPWSNAGDKQGVDDEKGRGVVLFHSLEYVRCKRPRAVLLENVKGLTEGANKDILATVVSTLQDLGYTVEWNILDTKDHGIPHSRPRFYLVGIRTRYLVRALEWPARLRRTSVFRFLDVDNKGSTIPRSKVFKEALAKASTKHGKKTLQDTFVIIDVGSSEKYSSSMVDCVPCITKSRGR